PPPAPRSRPAPWRSGRPAPGRSTGSPLPGCPFSRMLNRTDRLPGLAGRPRGYHPHVKVVVHDRTEELPARVRAYAEQRLLRVARHFDRVVEAEVEFETESRRGASTFCAVQINVRMDGRRHPLAQAREKGTDPKATLDLALDKVDRQVVRLKEKIKVEKKRPAAPTAEI